MKCKAITFSHITFTCVYQFYFDIKSRLHMYLTKLTSFSTVFSKHDLHSCFYFSSFSWNRQTQNIFERKKKKKKWKMVFLRLLFYISVLFNYIFESERRVQGSVNLKGKINFFFCCCCCFVGLCKYTNYTLKFRFSQIRALWFDSNGFQHPFFMDCLNEWQRKTKSGKLEYVLILLKENINLFSIEWWIGWTEFLFRFSKFISFLRWNFHFSFWYCKRVFSAPKNKIFSHGAKNVCSCKNCLKPKNLFQVWTFRTTKAISIYDFFLFRIFFLRS